MSFSTDKKWLEAKKVVGRAGNWIGIIEYYRHIGGENIFVYISTDAGRRMIIGYTEDDSVLLLTSEDELETEDIDTVMRSRKIFRYSDEINEGTYHLGSDTIKIKTERQRC